MLRLAKAIQNVRSHYDVIVVGSGYGGGVAASRLARCGAKVCMLERGREIQTGHFPRTLTDATKELQLTSSSHHVGSTEALFDVRLGDDIHVVVGCGLGGTSLINANVCLWPDERVFADQVWPAEMRQDGLLREGLARARQWLSPVPYDGPEKLRKVEALRLAARAMKRDLKMVPLHITFAAQTNAANVEQPACTLCGDCMTGCNVGAKTTTRTTYLADASHHGAEIFAHVVVRSVRKMPGKGWQVVCQAAGETSSAHREITISADIVVLAAGTLGSTEILLRSREQGLRVSERIGEQFSSNGDAFANAYNCAVPVNAVGVGFPAKPGNLPPVGPAVSGLVDLRDSARFEDGLAICECVLPSPTASMLPALLAPAAAVFGEHAAEQNVSANIDAHSRAAASLLGGPYKGAVANTQTFLAAGHDRGDGRMHLVNDRIAVSWPGASKQDVHQRSAEVFRRTTAAAHGTFLPSPIATRLMGEKLVTVHPLGGCAIGSDRSTGVVNHKCQVFDGSAGAGPDAVHDGLYVCDGSVIPRSLGIHPLLTITAVCERAMIHAARDRGWQLDVAPSPNAPRSSTVPGS